jgi:xanthine dehydrogenase YagR molybdenum-binding subunit
MSFQCGAMAIVGSAIAKAALLRSIPPLPAAPGVINIVTAQNAGKFAKGHFNTALLPAVEIHITTRPSPSSLPKRSAGARRCETAAGGVPANKGLLTWRPSGLGAWRRQFAGLETAVGDFAGAFAASRQFDATYTTARIAFDMNRSDDRRLDGDRLTLWTSNQMVVEHRRHGAHARHSEGKHPLDLTAHRWASARAWIR